MRPRSGFVAAVALLATFVTSCGHPSSAGVAKSGSSIVPWVNRPAPAFHWPAPPRRPPHDARACRARDLLASPGRTGVGLGNVNFRVELKVRAKTPCLLDGYPELVGITADGDTVRLHPNHGSYFGDPGPAANTGHGDLAAVNISSTDVCGHVDTPAVVGYRIGLPHDGGWVSVRSKGFRLMCHALSVSRFGVPADDLARDDDFVSPLSERIDAPDTMRSGTTLDFTVTIRNRSNRAYSLRPCPGYEAYLYASNQRADAQYQLNCDTVTSIPARGSVRYAMRLALPASMRPGRVLKFGWVLQVPGEPSTATGGQQVTA